MHFHGEVYVFHTNYRGVHMSDDNFDVIHDKMIATLKVKMKDEPEVS